MRMRMQMRADSEPDLKKAEEVPNRFMALQSGDESAPAGRVYTGDGYIQISQQRPAHIQR